MSIRWSLPQVLRERPAIRLNQLGYLPDGPKAATLVSGAAAPAGFTVAAADGTTVFAGRSRPWPHRPDPVSGLPVHTLDFSPVTVTGGGFRVVAGDDVSHPFRIAGDLYDTVAADALRFFYLIRSGTPITADRAPGYARPAGHPGDTAVAAWTGPDAERQYPGWAPAGTFDVSGGWYDAGDYGKYAVSGSIALWQLLTTAALYPGTALLEECRWQLDWMLRMQVPPGRSLAGTVFHRVHGTTWSPLPGLPHEDPTFRVLHRPSTAATLHLAAVAAQGARIFRPLDPAYGQRLLTAARVAYDAAQGHPRLLAPDDEGRFGGGPYHDDDLDDDFYWAAAELWLATGEPRFRTAVRESALHTADVFDPGGFDFHRVAAPARLDLAAVPGDLPDRDRVRQSVADAAERLLALQAGQAWGQPYAPATGWEWGSNGRILNNLVVLAAAADLTGDRRFTDGVLTGVDHLFGRNGLGQCYVTGYGADPSRHLRTRQFGHDLDPSLPPPPPGIVAGGPCSTDNPGFPTDPRLPGLPPSLCYLDEPTSEVTNDMCIRWNAPLVHIATRLAARR
jgi:endoglucanase